MSRAVRTVVVTLAVGAALAASRWFLDFATVNSDGFYYLTVARNVVETGVFTYDTLHSTSGFHWLWMGLLIVLSAAMHFLGLPLDGPALVAVVSVISCTFYVAAARELKLLLSAHPRLVSRGQLVWLLVVGVFLEPNLMALCINGLETSLFLFLLLRLIRVLTVQPSSEAVLTYVLLVLTRIEGAVMAPFLIRSGKSWIGRSAMAAAPLLMIVGLNYVVAGSFLSNSSEAKGFWARLAREGYLWSVPPSTQVNTIMREVAYAPGIVWQLLLSIRDDRLLGVASGLLFVAAGWIAFTNKAVVAQRLHWCPFYLLSYYCVVTWFAYKTVYFTPRGESFFAEFAVSDYQSVWYFAPLSLLFTIVLLLVLTSRGRRFASVAMPAVCLVGVLWIRAVTSRPVPLGDEQVTCEPPAPDAVYLAQNDDGFAYRYRLKVVVLDGLVTGRRLDTGAPYLAALSAGQLAPYLADLSPRFVRVGTERLLSNVDIDHEDIATLRSQPVVRLCGIGAWYQVAPDFFGATGQVGQR